MKRKFAIFDIDGTIFRSSLLIESVEALIKAGVYPARVRKHYKREHGMWLDRKGGYDKYIMGVVRVSDTYTKGVRQADYVRVVKKVVATHKSRVYRYTRDLIKELKRKRYFLLAITQSPKMVADEFGKFLGFDKIYGRLFEIDSRGRFTGDYLEKGLIDDKAKILKRAVLKEDLTLKGSVGVGDTESDIPFLKLVQKPICFNPNHGLYRFAQKKQWQVVVERKDVIYHL